MRILSVFLAIILMLGAVILPTGANDASVAVFVTLAGEGLMGDFTPESLCTPAGQAALAAVRAELDALSDAARRFGAEELGRSWYLSRALVLRLPADAVDDLSAMEGVALVEQLSEDIPLAPAAGNTAETASGSTSPTYAPDLLGIAQMQAEGMMGAGKIIAVIDTGYDLTHPVFNLPAGTEVTLTKEKLETLLPLTSLGAGQKTFSAADVWHSEKIPFAFDYQADDADVTTANEHGTHVASIAAGGTDTEGRYVGVAPGAQLLLMKIFDDSGSAVSSEYSLYRAVEDALLLGADVINLSLGNAPGFPYAIHSFSLQRHLDRIKEAGCALVCAVGNESAVGAGSVYDESMDIDLPLAANPDYGMTAEPATLEWTLAVGAYMPDTVMTTSLKLGDGSFLNFTDSAPSQGFGEMSFTRQLDGQTLSLVPVPGNGAPEDYAGLDVRGKLVLVQRGIITFDEKLRAAADAGAVGMICSNNEEGEINMAFTAMPIPAISVSMADGERLRAMPEADRTVIVSLAPASAYTPVGAGQPAEFSSVGSGLDIRPVLLAPGTVYAAMPGGTYRTKSGTSMATPVISGLAALFGCDLSEGMAQMITTAKPLQDENGVPFSVRVQGGGQVQAGMLAAAKGALRAADGRGVAELGDDLAPEKGVAFTLTLQNRGDTSKTYRLRGNAGSDGYLVKDTETGKTVTFADEHIRLFTEASVKINGTETNAGGEYIVALAAGETVTLTVEIRLTAEEAALYAAHFPNGYYLEGYIFAQSEDGESLSLPYLGFAGDFDALPYFDTFSYDGGDSFFPQYYLLSEAAGSLLYLGVNVYDDTVTADDFRRDLIAFSPNGDGFFDEAKVSLYLMRNLYAFEIEIRDGAGETVWKNQKSFYLNKTFLAEETLATGLGTVWSGCDEDNPAYVMPEGAYTAMFRVLTPEDGTAEEVELPIMLDLTPPELVSCEVITRRGAPTLSVTVQDNHYPMRAKLYRNAVDEYGEETSLYCDDHMFSYVKGRRTVTLYYDLTGYTGDYLYLDLYDYALNEMTYRIALDDLAS